MKKADPGFGSTFWGTQLLVTVYGSDGGGLSVPRSRLNTDAGNHDGMLASLATRKPITSINDAIVRGPLQSQSGRTTSLVAASLVANWALADVATPVVTNVNRNAMNIVFLIVLISSFLLQTFGLHVKLCAKRVQGRLKIVRTG